MLPVKHQSTRRIFDYVVVGGGSAGCVVANRLSKNPNVSVCLLEAGNDDKSKLIHTPALLGIVVGQNKVYNWCYETVPQKHVNNRVMFQPRGKCLGGSSSINAMVYIRGNKLDYDEWGERNPGWSWSHMLPHFLSTEKQTRDLSKLEAGYHSTEGELSVEEAQQHKLSKIFLDASKNRGYAQNSDFNGSSQDGFGFYQVTTENNSRCNTSKAFLSESVRARENLTIITNALTSKVIFEGKTATGVEYIDTSKSSPGQKRIVDVRNEVILSGGAFGSPQILLLSGVGEKKQLEKHNIPLVHELPGVGKNLIDHIDFILSCEEKGSSSYGLSIKTLHRNLSHYWEYEKKKEGPWSSNIAECGGFTHSQEGLKQPDLQFHFAPALLLDHARKTVFGHGYSLHVCILKPKSVGSISLKSTNPLDHPLIDPNYFSNPDDLETLTRGVKQAQEIFDDSAFDIVRKRDRLPGKGHTHDQLKEIVRNHSETVYHPVGTCKMGPSSDDMAVVDNQLKVHGIEGLRIADASIMPTIVGGNTNAPSIAIGEKLANLLKSP